MPRVFTLRYPSRPDEALDMRERRKKTKFNFRIEYEKLISKDLDLLQVIKDYVATMDLKDGRIFSEDLDEDIRIRHTRKNVYVYIERPNDW
jgi:hypothetical protein